MSKFCQDSGLSLNRAETLLQRYGTKALLLKDYCDHTDTPMQHHSLYSLGEIRFLICAERVEKLLDILLRRTSLAISGELNLAMIEEINQIMGDIKDWDQQQSDVELDNTLNFLETNHGLDRMTLTNRTSYGAIEYV
ncbi:MAG: hypothetical protein OFPI_31330 [Osedax symbiont Rs2]|nr:MAG: hypothetical protein OFPI_31330 [Osedax symbiont Rs2]